MNAPIVVQALRLGFLLVLWLFVFAVLRVVRRDIRSVDPTPPRDDAPPPGAPPAMARPGGAAQQPLNPGSAANPGAQPPQARGARSSPPASPQAPRELVVTAGSHRGTRIPLAEQPITIGRAEDSTLVLDDDYVSTRHARISRRGGAWYLDDLGSTNGTFLGADKVTNPVPAPVGIPIRIGTTVLELRP